MWGGGGGGGGHNNSSMTLNLEEETAYRAQCARRNPKLHKI